MTQRDYWVAGIAVAIGLALMAVLVVNGLNQHSPEGEGSPFGVLVAIPTAPVPVPAENGAVFCNLAGLSGELVSHPRWGIAVGGGPGEPLAVFWPNGWVGRTANDGIELLDAQGRVVARTGDQIKAAGGMTTINGVEGFGICPVRIEFQPATN
jgi:hypothetical protein